MDTYWIYNPIGQKVGEFTSESYPGAATKAFNAECKRLDIKAYLCRWDKAPNVGYEVEINDNALEMVSL